MAAPDESLGNAEQIFLAAAQLIRSLADSETLLDHAKNLPPDLKVRLIEAMGFTSTVDDHTADCPSVIVRGYHCKCVPPPTVWGQPNDVCAYRKETWEGLRALAEQWEREQSHGRRD